MTENYPFSGLPKAQGLYRPEHERDGCGIGFVADIEGRKSHDIVMKGVPDPHQPGAPRCLWLRRSNRRRQGILIQIPHAFFERECKRIGFALPAVGEYGIGMAFLPVDPHEDPL